MKIIKALGIFSFIFIINAFAFAQDNIPDWSVNPAQFENNGSITATVNLDGELVGSEDDILAAFFGDEVRGVTNGIDFPPGGYFAFFLTVYSDYSSGETLTFRYYNLATDTIYELGETVDFASNMLLGDPFNPFEFSNVSVDCNDVPGGDAYLDGCGVCDNDPSNDNESCSGCIDPDALNYDPDATIDDGSCVYPEGTEWQVNPADFEFNGSLTAQVIIDGNAVGSEDDQLAAFVNGQVRGVTTGLYYPPGDYYLFLITIYSNDASGETVDFEFYQFSDDLTYSIVETTVFTANMFIGDPNNPVEFHTGGGGEVEDCNGVLGGDSYLDQCGVCDNDPLNDNETCSGCTDPTAMNFDPTAIVDDGSCEYAGSNELWEINPSEFEFNGSVIARVFLDGSDSGSEDDMLAAFVDGEIRGVTGGLYYPPGGYTVFMLSVFSNASSDETIAFQFFDSENSLIYTLDETVEFTANMIEGSVNDPIILNGELVGPDWPAPNPSDFEFNGNITAAIYVNDAQYNSETLDKVAVFVDGEIRGVTSGMYFAPTNTILFLLTVFSNESSGEMMTFQFYDAFDDVVYEVDDTIEFVTNMFNSPLEPVHLNLTTDCLGVPGGNAVEDCAGICDGSAELDCAGVCDGDAVEDCAGVCDGSAELDCAGVCDGDAVEDCAGICEGLNLEDNCGVCDEDTGNDCVQDCNGEWGGSAEIDCAGVCEGTSVIDDCGDCGGNNEAMDCADVCNGPNTEDECGVCDEDTGNDCIQDCNGEWGGDAELDCFGVCGGDATEEDCTGCMDPDANNWCEECTIDCGDECCDFGTQPPEDWAFNQSTAQAFYFFTDAIIEDITLAENEDWIGVFKDDVCVGNGIWEGPYTLVLAMGDDNFNYSDGYLLDGEIPQFKIYDFSEDLVYDADATGAVPGLEFHNLAQIFVDLLTADIVLEGCMDINACNYDPDVTIDDGSCIDPIGCNEWCPGDVTDPLYDDCAGVCGGDAVEDCAGICDGASYEDECFVCDDDPDNDCIQDCNGEWGGTAEYDCAGICEGTAEFDCAGVCDGDNYEDECLVCDDDPENDCVQDCFGEWGGTAEYDCAGVCGGSSYVDDCGICDDNFDNDCAPMDLVAAGGDSQIILNWLPPAMNGTRSAPDWSVNQFDFENSGSVTASVSINETLVGSDSDLLAAFVGDEVRGVTSGLFFPVTGEYVFQLLIYSNELSGESLTFQFYNSAEDMVYDVTETLSFEANMTVGNSMTPFEMNVTVEDTDTLVYNVYRDGSFLAGDITLTTYTDDGLGYDENHCYTVTALINGTEYDQSNEDCATTFGNPAPVLISATGGTNQISLLWEYGDPNSSRTAPDWSVNQFDFENSGSVTASVSVNGVLGGSEDDLLAAFIGDEVRGVTSGLFFPVTQQYVFQLLIYSNELSGETMTFKYYDSAADMIYDVEEPLAFEANMTVGNSMTPFTMNVTFEDEDVTTFNVYREGTMIAMDVTGFTYTNTGLGNNETWCYTVTADNNGEETPHSNEECGTTDDFSAPQNLVATGGDNVISLTWDSPSGGSRGAPDWSVNQFDFENSGSVTASITVNGTLTGSEDDMIAAFVGEEIRGVASGLFFPVTSEYVFQILAYSNQLSGETLTFKYYNAAADMVYDVNETLQFEANMTVGNSMTPFEMNVNFEVEETYTYNVYRDGILIAMDISSTSHSNTSLGYNESHCYTVTSELDGSESGHSNEDCATTNDCAGVQGGLSLVDECDVCDDDPNNDCVEDCLGEWGGSAEYDCANVCDGPNLEDNCGVCDEDTENDCIQDCLGEWGGTAEFDCANVCDGPNYVDNCDVCDDDTENDCVEDCLGEWGGSAEPDCAGVCEGPNLEDNCGVCDEDAENDCVQDCLGEWGGTAEYDCEGICDGGAVPDCAGICNGGNEPDCAGVCDGPNLMDMCGICDEDESNNCIEDCNDVWGGEAYPDDCGICCAGDTEVECSYYEEDPLDYGGAYDCSGECFGDAITDECGVCEGDNSSCNAPVAGNMEEQVIENNPHTFTLDASDPNDDLLTININIDVSHGVLSCEDGTLMCEYTPNLNFDGVDWFTYNVSDNDWTSNNAFVYLAIVNVNNSPIALSQDVQILEDHSIVLSLAGLDEDTDDENLLFEILDQPSHGLLESNRALADYTYTPNQDYFGEDNFTFYIWDAVGLVYSNIADVNIQITAVNDQPVIEAVISSTGSFLMNENESLDITFEVSDIEGDDLEIQFAGGSPFFGNMESNSDLEFTYTPDAGYYGIDEIVAIAVETTTDELSASNPVSIDLEIINVNDAPTAFETSLNVDEDGMNTVNLFGSDPEDSELTFNITVEPFNGVASIDGNTLTYTPVANYNGSDVLFFNSFDGELSSTDASVTINVYAQNDIPTAEDFTFTFAQDPDIMSLESHIADIDIGDELTVEFIPEAENGTGFSAFGAIVIPGPDYTYNISSGFMSPDYLVYKVKDDVSESAVGLITLINPNGRQNEERDIPLAYNQTVDLLEDTPSNFSLLGLDVTSNWPAEGATYQITQQPVHGSYTDNSEYELLNPLMAEWVLQYTPDNNYFGLDTIKFTLTNPGNSDGDPVGVSNEAIITFNINPVNDIPSITTIGNQTTDEDVPLVLPFAFNDPENLLDVTTNTSNNDVTVVVQNQIGPNGLGDNSAELLITPSDNFSGTTTITVTVTESNGSDLYSSSELFNITVNPVNDPPVVINPGDQEFAEDSELVLNLFATDLDGEISFTFAAEVTDNAELLSIQITDNQLTLIPAANLFGTATVSVTANDLQPINSESDAAVFVVTITNVNDTPEIVGLTEPDPIIEDGGSILVQFTIEDIDPDELLTVSVITSSSTLFPLENINLVPDVPSISGTEFLVALEPAPNENGTATMIVTVSDGEANSSEQVLLTILGSNDEPELNAIGDQTVEEDGSLTLSLSTTDLDNEPTDMVYSVTDGTNITAVIDGSEVTFTPDANYFGSESFTVSVTDGIDSDSEVILVTVTGVDDAPVITSTSPNTVYLPDDYSYQVEVSDNDPEDLVFTYSLFNEPDGMVVSDQGLVTWEPSEGTYTSGLVALTVADADDLTDTENFEIDVIHVDCYGVPNGTAITDDCDQCCGGNTGETCSYWFSETNFGGLYDCNQVCEGDAILDECNECVDGDTGEVACVPYEIIFHLGSNLRSFYSLPEDASLSVMLVGLEETITGISGEGVAAQYIPGPGWVGNLTAFDLWSSYWFLLNEIDTLNVIGLAADGSVIYNLHAGSNFISYPFDTEMDINDAFPDAVCEATLGIIGESEAAFCVPGSGWFGNLDVLRPTYGYILQMDEAVTFSYNSPPALARNSDFGVAPSIYDNPDEFRYVQSSQQAFYFIENIEIDNSLITNEDWLVAYFDGEVVGARQWNGEFTDLPIMGYDGSTETENYLMAGDIPEIRIYDSSENMFITIESTIPEWSENALYILGDIQTFNGGTIPQSMNLLPAYPNPFNPVTEIRYEIAEQSNVSLVVVNMVGQKVVELVNTQQAPGTYSITWNASDQASGIYFVKLISGSQVMIQKVMLVK
ncbi:MAG: tandem-95 repeat protein [Candidatus Marinimicrobia bacterium]|nr:tandem-95 repeat protein [Candidatus Neomarinimicrobiota bacterium]